ncbi:UNVERIFIED_CONTAM: hypothetical protein BJ099_101180 [Lysinibacillus xylanilyticus]
MSVMESDFLNNPYFNIFIKFHKVKFWLLPRTAIKIVRLTEMPA